MHVSDTKKKQVLPSSTMQLVTTDDPGHVYLIVTAMSNTAINLMATYAQDFSLITVMCGKDTPFAQLDSQLQEIMFLNLSLHVYQNVMLTLMQITTPCVAGWVYCMEMGVSALCSCPGWRLCCMWLFSYCTEQTIPLR